MKQARRSMGSRSNAAVLPAHATGLSTRGSLAVSAMDLAARLVHAATYAFGITVIGSATEKRRGSGAAMVLIKAWHAWIANS